MRDAIAALAVAALTFLPASPAAGTGTAGMTATQLVGRAATGAPGTHLFGVALSGIGQLPEVTALAARLHHPLDVVNVYVGWDSPFPSRYVEEIAAAGAVPEITWEPWRHQLGLHQDTYPLTSIASGALDRYVEGWARAAAAWGKPLLLRFAQEMNGDWYPWDVGVNGNSALDYVGAYRHVHDVFDAAGARNVLWIWSPNVTSSKTPTLASMYPGSSYVDFVGIDGYNSGVGIPYGWWASPAQVFGKTLADVATFAAGKPVLITETGSSERGGSKAAWIGQFFAYLATQPEIVGFVWSEYPGRADWPIETSPASEAAMRAGLASY